MGLKEVFAPHLGRTVKLGRVKPRARCPRLSLKNYLKLPAAPAACDYSQPAASALANIYLNDQLGDCVIAGGYHVVGVETGNVGDLWTATDQQIIEDYSAIGGYNPSDPSTDQGCDETTALNYWVQHGFANGTKLAGWAAVDCTDQEEVKAALYLFENLYFGVELPDAWISPFPSSSGFTWDVGTPDPQNGHCFTGVGYDANGVQICTWGLIGTMTWAAVASLCSAGVGELYTMLSPDQIAKGQLKAPNGMEWNDLLGDIDSIGGNAPAPAPAPSPVQPPSPGPPLPQVLGPTLAEAQAILAAGWPPGAP